MRSAHILDGRTRHVLLLELFTDYRHRHDDRARHGRSDMTTATEHATAMGAPATSTRAR